MSEDKLNIKNEMAQFDRKNRAFYDSLSDEERRKFSPYLMIRWGSAVIGDPDLQAYYVMSANERLNKNFFDISTSQHKKFQWLLATTVSPGLGTKTHTWIAPKKKTTDNKAINFLRQRYPHLKEDDIRVLNEINTKDELKSLAKDMGWSDRDIKKEL